MKTAPFYVGRKSFIVCRMGLKILPHHDERKNEKVGAITWGARHRMIVKAFVRQHRFFLFANSYHNLYNECISFLLYTT